MPPLPPAQTANCWLRPPPFPWGPCAPLGAKGEEGDGTMKLICSFSIIYTSRIDGWRAWRKNGRTTAATSGACDPALATHSSPPREPVIGGIGARGPACGFSFAHSSSSVEDRACGRCMAARSGRGARVTRSQSGTAKEGGGEPRAWTRPQTRKRGLLEEADGEGSSTGKSGRARLSPGASTTSTGESEHTTPPGAASGADASAGHGSGAAATTGFSTAGRTSGTAAVGAAAAGFPFPDAAVANPFHGGSGVPSGAGVSGTSPGLLSSSPYLNDSAVGNTPGAVLSDEFDSLGLTGLVTPFGTGSMADEKGAEGAFGGLTPMPTTGRPPQTPHLDPTVAAAARAAGGDGAYDYSVDTADVDIALEATPVPAADAAADAAASDAMAGTDVAESAAAAAEGDGTGGTEAAVDDGRATGPPPPLLRKPGPRPEQFKSWQIDERFELVRLLGKGSYGAVAEATDLATGKRVAIKQIRNVFDVLENAKRIFREIKILRLLRHPNIIRIVHLQAPEDMEKFRDLYVVFECMDTDFAKLTYDTTQYLTLAHVRWLFYQLLLGVKYMHSALVIHRDIKPANVLLTETCDLKLCDFGLARSIDFEDEREPLSSDSDGDPPDPPSIKRQMTRHVVTRWYRAPELIYDSDGTYTAAIDMWSCGCVLAEMLGMLEDPTADPDEPPKRRTPLFPGSSCYPMSGDRDRDGTRDYRSDQMEVIAEVLGSPTPEQIERARTHRGRKYLRSLHKRPAKDLRAIYPGASPESLDLLRRCVTLLPDDRITVDEALSHPFLKKVYHASEVLECDTPASDFIFYEGDDIRALIANEIAWYNVNCRPKAEAMMRRGNARRMRALGRGAGGAGGASRTPASTSSSKSAGQ